MDESFKETELRFFASITREVASLEYSQYQQRMDKLVFECVPSVRTSEMDITSPHLGIPTDQIQGD